MRTTDGRRETARSEVSSALQLALDSRDNGGEPGCRDDRRARPDSGDTPG
ncbi:hypothetical protein [Sphaerisporangium sp. TRM90804]|nr:hypothetical protein [Sphaerisporangium sp. TRM90804]MDH2427984.1 hypothetical protein [Sphaerisporangium sp. TRM90804]